MHRRRANVAVPGAPAFEVALVLALVCVLAAAGSAVLAWVVHPLFWIATTVALFRQAIAEAAMAELCDPETGEPMLEKVIVREDIYHGPELERAADLILVPRYGYDLKGAFGKESLTFKGDALVGMHTYDDAMIAVRNHPIASRGFSIVDATATALKLMGVEPPAGLDSRALL